MSFIKNIGNKKKGKKIQEFFRKFKKIEIWKSKKYWNTSFLHWKIWKLQKITKTEFIEKLNRKLEENDKIWKKIKK